MKLSTRYQARGVFRIFKGTAKEFAGKVIFSKALGVRGRLDRLAGRLQWKIGKVQGFCGF